MISLSLPADYFVFYVTSHPKYLDGKVFWVQSDVWVIPGFIAGIWGWLWVCAFLLLIGTDACRGVTVAV